MNIQPKLFGLIFILAAPINMTLLATEVHIHEAPGNLQPTHSVDCVEINNIKNHMTPADLLPAALKCMNNNEYQRGIEIFFAAGSYGYFDTLRVSDTTAHDATQMLMLEFHDKLNNTQINELKSAVPAYVNKESKEHINFCLKMEKLGPPDYYPLYMIQHGLHVFLPKGEGHDDPALIKNFDANQAWQQTMERYLHCTSSNSSNTK